MKIAITGHSKGLGKVLSEYFNVDNNQVTGFSRSNGYDISIENSRQQILSIIKDYDLFVNNAYNNFDRSQYILLESVYKLWQGQNKLIINVSSRYTTDIQNPYCLNKRELDKFCENKIFKMPHILNIKPGLMDTERVSNQKEDKMSLNQTVQLIDFCLKNKVQSITFGL
jgi:hypothetical protein